MENLFYCNEFSLSQEKLKKHFKPCTNTTKESRKIIKQNMWG